MDWKDYTTAELASFYSDYHKDIHGVRPRGIFPYNRGDLIEGLQGLDRYILNMKATPEGRAKLRAEGWVMPEDD